MPKDKVLKSLDARKKLLGGTMSLDHFRAWAHDKFGKKLGEKVYQTAKKLKAEQLKERGKLIKGRQVPGTPGTHAYESKSLRPYKRKGKLSLEDILEYHKKLKKKKK